MTVSSRPCDRERDYRLMRELVIDLYRAGGQPVYCLPGDLDWWLATNPGGPADIQLWLEDGGRRLAAIGWSGGGYVELLVHPSREDLQDEMLAWAEEGWRARGRAEAGKPAADPPKVPPDHTALRTWSYDCHEAKIKVLEGRGYVRGDAHFRDHARLLADPHAAPVPEPVLPPGYRIRPMAGEAEVAERVAVHRAAFAPSRMTVEKHLAAMKGATYRPDLDLVVVAPDGSFAAFTIAWFDPATRTGEFEPVGCHPDHRRRGLAKTLLHYGMRRFLALGATAAYVSSWWEEPGATALYESAGLPVVFRNFQWTKAL